ncbi:MerR family transcriptional regulator [Aquabacterium sp.]|uniref:MerR family transcriptional regulator n=1 Tax=Aquabacterium sp. TaxID=1872578 RepID=UPI0019A86C92|nr:MerR family transcriptional regulator [Aquabacterium sp.]MBC7699949.1 MerR family transcriptional regulator [Aquabacterium sp.]
MDSALPPIPAKRYFTIGEVSELCLVKPYVLRYWEQEFVQLKPMKRRGNRRYYQHHEVLLIRRIRELLYDQGFTISGARNRLSELGARGALPKLDPAMLCDEVEPLDEVAAQHPAVALQAGTRAPATSQRVVHASPETAWLGPDVREVQKASPQAVEQLREALLSIRELLE